MFAMTYVVAEDAVGDVTAKIAQVISAIRESGSPIRYASTRVGGTNRFVHVVDLDADPQALDNLPEFAEFQKVLKGALQGPPHRLDLSVIDSYGFGG